jgi:uncharacterized protein YecE (DUF72 family)
MIRMGTSGFSYDDWVGPVYPKDLPRWRWLPFYASMFDTVELNVTYYRHADRKMASGWVQRSPEGFLFSVKAHGSLTHERSDPEVNAFRESLAPLLENGRLGCVLAQFPQSFHNTPDNAGYLPTLRDYLEDLPVVIEFRSTSWMTEDALDLLRRLNFGFWRTSASMGETPPSGGNTRTPGSGTTTHTRMTNCGNGCRGCES